jgi:Major Facilitator Superfamily
LTFLLSSPPYNYSTLEIGLFALIGISIIALGPPWSRMVIDRYVPLFSTIIGEIICLVGQVIGTYTGTFTIAGPIIQAILIDFGLQTSQVANRAAIYSIEPKARNRVNTAFMLFIFFGQIMGTSVSARLYAEGGWRASGSACVGFISLSIVIALARGPWEEGWVGWSGGWSIRRKDLKENPPGSTPQRTDVEEGLEEMAASEENEAPLSEKAMVHPEKSAQKIEPESAEVNGSVSAHGAEKKEIDP